MATSLRALTDSWNNAGTTFTALKMNVTDSASNAASLLMDLQVAGSSKFKVRKDGLTTVNSIAWTTGGDHGTLTGLGDDDHTGYARLAGRSGGQTLIGGTGTTDDLILRATAGAGASGSDIIFQVGNNGGTEAARILQSGNFGIGVATPEYKLQIGQAADGIEAIPLHLQNIASLNGSAVSIAFGLATSGVNTAKIQHYRVSNPDRGLSFYTYDGAIGERMRIQGNGNLGVGTTLASARIHGVSTTEQLRIGYDVSNYFSATVSSAGLVTLNAVGASAAFEFSDGLRLTQTVTTEAVTSDTTVSIVINGTTYKLLAKA